MRKQKVNRWEHAILEQGDELIRLVTPMRRLPGCLRSQHIQTNQGCLTQELGLAGTFGILPEQLPHMRELIRGEPNPFRDRHAWFLRGYWFAVHHDFFAAINRTAKSAPTELSAEARSRFTRK